VTTSLKDINEKLLTNEKLAEEINGVLEKHEDEIRLLSSSMSSSNTNHIQTVEKVKELSVLIANIKEQMIIQETNIAERSTSDFNDIKSKIQEIENRSDISEQKIREVDNGNVSLLEKLITLEKDIGEKCTSFEKADKELLDMITQIDSDNNINITNIKTEFNSQITALFDKNISQEKLSSDFANKIKLNTVAISEMKEKLIDALKTLEGELKHNIDEDLQNNKQQIVMMKDKNDEMNNELKQIFSLIAELNSKTDTSNQNISSNHVTITKLSDVLDNSEKKMNTLNASIENFNTVVEKFELHNQQSDKKINELSSGNQSILQKMQDQEKEFGDRFDMADDLLMSKFDNLDSNNSQLISQMKDDLKIKFKEIEENSEVYLNKQSLMEQELQKFYSEKDSLSIEITKINDDNTKSLNDMKAEVDEIWNDLEKRLLSSMETNEQSQTSLNTEFREKLESIDVSLDFTYKELRKLLETSTKYTQNIQTLEILNDKISNFEDNIQINNTKLKVDFIEHIAKTTDEMKQYVQLNLDELEKLRHKEHVSLSNDTYHLAKQIEELKDKNSAFEERVLDINTDQQQMSRNLSTIQENCDTKFKSINENESSLMNKLKDIDEDNKTNFEKIIAIEELAMLQSEKAKYIESLTSRVNQIDEMRQMSETKAKEDFDKSVSKNARGIEDLKNSLEQTMTKIELHLKEENTTLKEENTTINILVKSLQEDAVKQNEQLIKFLKEKSELEIKLEETIKESSILRERGAELKTTLANYEGAIDKKITKLQNEAQTTLELVAQLEPRFKSFDKQIAEINVKNTDMLQESTMILSNETKNHIDLMRKEIDTAFMVNNEKIAEFEQAVHNLKVENENAFKEKEQHILSLISTTTTHTTDISEIQVKLQSYDVKQKAIVENLLITSEAQLNEIRKKYDGKFSEILSRCEKFNELMENTELKIMSISDHSRKVEEDIYHSQRDIEELKQRGGTDKELIVMKIKEQKETLESFFRSLETKMEILETTQIKESSRVQSIEKQTDSSDKLASRLEDRIYQVEKFGERQNSLILAVEKTTNERVEELGSELMEFVNSSREDLRNLRFEMNTDKDNFWTLLLEIYSTFRGYTVVIKSEGAVHEHQADVLGVYRMVDSYNDRPVYKQDGGENYIYYSSMSNTWFVGTVVGHQYGWLRNGSSAASSKRWLPDLSSGWEYRPLVRSSASLEQTNNWLSDDGTLRIESLRDVEKVSEMIRDLKEVQSVE